MLTFNVVFFILGYYLIKFTWFNAGKMHTKQRARHKWWYTVMSQSHRVRGGTSDEPFQEQCWTLNTFNMHKKLNKTQIRESSKGYRPEIKAVCVCCNEQVNNRRKIIRFCKCKSVNVKKTRGQNAAMPTDVLTFFKYLVKASQGSAPCQS